MTARLEELLAPYADDAEVVREIHDVPPYRVYEVRLDGRRAVLKRDAHPRGHAADEGRVHEYVADHTAASVPDVLAVGPNHYVTAWNEDVARASDRIDAAWARAAGRWLGTLHDDTAGAFDGFGRPRDGGTGLELEARADWLEAVLDRIEFHRSFLADVGYAAVADAVSEFLRTHPHVLDSDDGDEPVLCHGDVHPEHIVGTADGTTAAIDFEHALVAPAEYDYWRTAIPYFETRDDIDETALRAFRDGYESVRPLPDDLERRRPIYKAITGVAFLESLFLQDNVEPDRRAVVADRLRDIVVETIAGLRESRETAG